MAVEAGVASGLVGRDTELADLEGFLEAATTAPRKVLLEGEPGIGKTSLWRTAVEHARRSFRVLSARPAEAEATLSFSALGDLLAGKAETIRALPDPQRRALRVALLMEEHEGAATDSRTLSVALLGLLRELAQDGPVLVAVDDVQWLDPSTAGVLAFALRRVEAAPISFLGTTRPAAARIALEDVETIAVGPLDVSAVDAIVRRALDVPPPRPLLRRIGRASGGNPFYAHELARAFIREQEKFLSSDRVPLPASLSDLLRARLDALPSSARPALAAVAALAQPTPKLVEQAVAADAPGLDAAIAAGIIEVDGAALAFTHPLLAAAVYAEIDPQARRVLHARLAEVVSDREERARHLALAVEPPDGDVAQALEDAAEGAFVRGATESAAELTEHAVRFTPGASAEALHRRRLAAAGYLARTGAKERARERLRQAQSAAPAGPARARIALTATWFGLLDPSSCIEALRDAVEDARGDPLLLVKIHSALAPMLLQCCDLPGAERHAATALELAEEIGDNAHLVLALVGVAHAAFFAGRGIDGDTIERAVALEADAGNPYGNVTVASGFLGSFLATAGKLEDARRIFETKAAEERRRGDIGVAGTLSDLARVEIRAGNWHRAQELAEESLDVAREAADVELETLAQRRLLAIAVLRGERERARKIAAEGLRLAELGQTPLSHGEIVSLLGLLELSLDNPEAAVSYFEEVARFVDEAGFRDPDILPCVPDQVEALIATGDLEHAEAATADLESQARQLDRKPTLAVAARCRGHLAAARGDLATAIETLAEARDAAVALGHPFELARTLLVEGTILRRAKRIGEARERLDGALTRFEGLGAAVWAERARRELARLGGRASQSGRLTKTEEQIADLVASGKSNNDVARTLHVSPKTVEWNLSKIYRKLHVSSRTELAAKRVAR